VHTVSNVARRQQSARTKVESAAARCATSCVRLHPHNTLVV
jgi:hypothetical protein